VKITDDNCIALRAQVDEKKRNFREGWVIDDMII
jgi:hypothetical protein